MKKTFARLFAASVLVFSLHSVADEEGPALDTAPINLQDVESLQRGAKLFSNYCLSCHSAQAMRYNRLTDLGLSLDQIKDNLIFTGAKPGDLMKVGMTPAQGKLWLGAPPPDLSVIARSRSADWLYTYLRSFYRDDSRPTGWNNAVFDKVGMPHVLWQLQGDQVLNVVDGDEPGAKGAVTRSWPLEEEGKDGQKHIKTAQLVLTKPGQLTELNDGKAKTLDYDSAAADLVNYLVWMSEPAQVTREHVGYGVLLFLIFLLAPLSYFLKKEYWRDVH